MNPLLGIPSILAVLASATGVWPLSPPPQVVHPFQPPSEIWGSGHRGVDLGGRIGEQVVSAVAGTVSFAGTVAGTDIVVVTQGDTRTTYQPVAPLVSVGQAVSAGQPIGRLELLGSHCFPAACLHWGLLRGDQYLDPSTLVEQAPPVRLLPLDSPVPVPTLPAVPSMAPRAPIGQVRTAFTQLLSQALRVVGSPLTPGGGPAGTPSAADPP